MPEIRWTAGLSAWRLGRMHLAAWHFAKLAQAESALPAERARAAFWAARAYLVQMRPAAGQPLPAARRDRARLLRPARPRRSWAGRSRTAPTRSPSRTACCRSWLRYPGVRRAIALGQIGQVAQAEREIRKLAARAAPELMAGLVALAKSLDLPAAQMRLAQSLGRSDGRYDLSALFPVPTWRPANGYTLDRALVFAFMRAESGFDPRAESHAGARGLMQVMPATAQYIAARDRPRAPARQRAVRARDEHPVRPSLSRAPLATAVDRRQSDLSWRWPTMRGPAGSSLLAGDARPSRTIRCCSWSSIPLREPRVYVKKVLTNLWTYRARFGQAQSSLEGTRHRAAGRPTARSTRDSQVHAWN